MARVQLRNYIQPGLPEVFINLKSKDGTPLRQVAAVDTGAQTSLLPSYMMEQLEYRLVDRESFVVEQAGIAQQAFEAREAMISLFLEDEFGNRTDEFEAKVWFAATSKVLVGFDSILDRAILHIDMPNRSGYLEINPIPAHSAADPLI